MYDKQNLITVQPLSGHVVFTVVNNIQAASEPVTMSCNLKHNFWRRQVRHIICKGEVIRATKLYKRAT